MMRTLLIPLVVAAAVCTIADSASADSTVGGDPVVLPQQQLPQVEATQTQEPPLPGPVGSAAPRIRLTDVEFYWDVVFQGKTFTKDWVVHNDGDMPLKISHVSTKCPCSTFEFPPEIAPGEQGVVKLIFNSNKIKAGGTTKKSGVIHTNDPAYPQVKVWFGGGIQVAFRHRPGSVVLRGLKTDRTSIPVTIFPATATKFELLSTSVTYDQFEVESVNPSPDTPDALVLVLTKKAVEKAETKPDFVKLKMRMADGDEIEPYIPVRVIHQDPVVITPSPEKTIIFMNRETNRLLKDESTPIQKRLTINGANPQIKLNVLDARLEVPEKVPDGVFQVRIEESRKDYRYNVILSIHKYPSITYTDGKVFIDVDDGTNVTTHEVSFRAMFAGRR